jgi:hypothetical protein
MTVVPNDNDELIPQRVVVGYRMCIDFRKVNKVTKKDHYPLPFIDQMLERLSKNTHFCFLEWSRTVLDKETPSRIYRQLGKLRGRVRQELQVHVQKTCVVRGVESMSTKARRANEKIYPKVEHHQKLGRKYI